MTCRRWAGVLSICMAAMGVAARPAAAQPSGDFHDNLSYVVNGPTLTATRYLDGVTEQVPSVVRWKPICGGNMTGVTQEQFAASVEAAKAAAALMPVEVVDSPSPRVGLNIVYNLTNAPAGAAAAVAAVETYLEGQFTDPITVTINITWANLGGGGVLGATGSSSTTASYSTVRSALIAGKDSDDTLQDFLPAGATVPVNFNSGSATVTNVSNITVNTANYRAFIGAINGNPDGDMQINTNFAFDYDPTNGVPANQTCFRSVLAHETLHALGFVSEGDGSGTTNIDVLDLFRFRRSTNNPNSTATFTTTPRAVWTTGRIDDVNTDLISAEYAMSWGGTGNYQASHFKDQGGIPSTAIGIMQPAMAGGVTFHPNYMKASDLTAMDAIGWDHSNGPLDTSPPTPNPMTFAVPPTALGPNSIMMSAVTATDAQNNTITYFFDYLGAGGLGAEDSSWQSFTTYNDLGLQENTSYSYCVRARDSAPTPNETTCSTPASTAVTLINPPDALMLSNVNATTLNATPTGTLPNLNLGSSGVYIDWVLEGGSTPVGNSGWRQTSAAYGVSGLSPNQGYTFRAMARNQQGVETTVVESALVHTLAAVPGAPILGSPTATTMTINVDPANNPPQTEFSIWCVSTSPLDVDWDSNSAGADGNPHAVDTWRTDAQWGTTTLLGMKPNTTYQFVVYARNVDLVGSIESALASLSTTGGVVHGDCSGDNFLSPTIDTSCFINVLLGVNVDSGAILRSDLNLDGLVDGRDVAPFVNCVVNGCP